ncbi:MAG TPA: hypothetical protein VNJ08_03030 [Bacteriovoracaceae bacterium]|nr:hypothetical protein [Bacteriovoracaceae bacterium]
MTALVRFSVLLTCLFSQTILATIGDDFKFQMDGSFLRRGSPNDLPTRFSLKWNENKNQISGVYSDNYFATTETTVVGLTRPEGRSFTVVLPDISRGAKTIDIQSQFASDGPISATFTIKDAAGLTSDFYTLAAIASTDPTVTEVADAADPEISCVVGLGTLTGFCGMYAGTVSKATDSSLRCQELTNARLELTPGGDFKLHLEEIFALTGGNFVHNIGSLNGAGPVTTMVSVSGRNCGDLMGTSFMVQNCQTLNLAGTFSNFAGVRSFAGTYTIRDNVNGDSCTFSLGLERQ